MIEDVKDIFFLPHDVARYVNYVWFDFVTGASLTAGTFPGSGGILFGNAADNSFGIGITTHRADYQGAFADALLPGDFFSLSRNAGIEDIGFQTIQAAGDPLVSSVNTLNWIDLMAGFALSPDFSLGARLSLGGNVDTTADREGDEAGDLNPGASASSFNAIVSAGFDSDNMSIDGAIELSTASYGGEVVGPDGQIEDSAGAFGIGLFGRAFFQLNPDIELGAYLTFGTRSRSTDLEDPADTRVDAEMNELLFSVGVGPIYKIGDEAIISAYATLGISQTTIDPEGINNLTDDLRVLLPGITISAEWWLTEWFAFRSGLVSQYMLISGEVQIDDEAGAGTLGQDLTARSLVFYWSTGIGFSALEGDFNFDAMLNAPIITAGPYIFSGTQQDIFGMVTTSYAF